MPVIEAKGVRLYYETTGTGDPMLLIHGSWSDHLSWDRVVPGLSERFRVVTYDRRGHSQARRWTAKAAWKRMLWTLRR